MRHVLRTGAVLAALALAGGIATPARAAKTTATTSAKPNILWIGVDQMRQDTPGCYGNRLCKTPNIDRLARDGVTFTRAYTTCCLCSPARASMFTGRFAFHHGMGTNCDLYHSLARELPHPETLLHHRLKARGYRCGFVGKWHVGTDLGPVDHGFEGMNLPGYGDIKNDADFQRYLTTNGLSFGPVQNPIFGNPRQKTLMAGHWNGPTESTPAYYLANTTIKMLEEYAANSRPFFLTCQFWGPHSPHLPSPEFLGMHDRSAIEPWKNFKDNLHGKPESVRRFRRDFYRNLPDDWASWREVVGLYYDFTTMIDQQIGRILDQLDALGLADNTLVIFVSDHGDMLGCHGGLFDKGFMYEEAFRIPMIVRWPGARPASGTSDALVYNMDIMPTILDLLGTPDDTLDGQSFLPALQGKPLASPRENIYLEFHGIRYLYSQRALVTRDGYKYIFNPGDQDEFYDLNTDPAELANVIDAERYAKKVAAIREQIKAAARTARDPISDYVAKLFGDWEKLSGQFESAAYDPGQERK
ncbi:MAG: sulfatase-like hydrolase/transferase [Phycisphaerae bacterium]|nr:sulfatase-like hydrolase/transferase [Phycisphaerae bacterium]